MNKTAVDFLPVMQSARRQFHAFPEEGFCEKQTQSYILEQLAAYACFQVTPMCQTGVRAVFLVPGAKRTIAFRADMDALMLTEQSGAPYASKHPGFMHACGHDGHMAMLLGLAHAIGSGAFVPKTNVVLIFQPAEESTGGAKPMVEAGCLQNPDVDEVYAIHLWPGIDFGKVAVQEGPVMAQTSEVDITFEGLSCHGAMPQEGKDALLAAAYFLTQAQSVVARGVNPCRPALFTIGKFDGGTRRNVVAKRAVLQGILRTFDEDVYKSLRAQLLDALAGMEKAFGVTTSFEEKVYYPPVINHPATTKRALQAAGAEAVGFTPRMTAEDFSYYQQKVPGTLLYLGIGQDAPALHSDTFDFDESVMAKGLTMFLKLCGAMDA